MPSFVRRCFANPVRATSTHLLLFSALSITALILGAAPALADHLMDWGTQTSAYTASCPSFCTSFNFAPSDGGPLTPSSTNSISDTRGNAQAAAEFSTTSGISVPFLRAEAFGLGTAPTTNSAGASAYAAEGYTYTGTVPKTLVVDITMTGDVFDPADNTRTDVSSLVIACGADGFVFGLSGCDFGEVPPFADVLDSASLVIEQTETNGVRTAQLSFDVVPGQSFYLRASLEADAVRDNASAESFNSLSMVFQDSSDLVTATSGAAHGDPPASVPGLGLPALGLLGLLLASCAAFLFRPQAV